MLWACAPKDTLGCSNCFVVKDRLQNVRESFDLLDGIHFNVVVSFLRLLEAFKVLLRCDQQTSPTRHALQNRCLCLEGQPLVLSLSEISRNS